MIDKLIADSSIGAGIANIRENGVEAEIEDIAAEAAPRKRRKGTSPTARTLAELRKRGWTAQVVERRLPRTFTTVDLFGVIDLVAIVPPADDVECSRRDSRGTICSSAEHESRGHDVCHRFAMDGEHQAASGSILGIQATSGTNHASRRTKILAEPRAAEWVAAGGRLELWTWSQRVAQRKDGSKAARPKWTLRVETYEEMAGKTTGLPDDV